MRIQTITTTVRIIEVSQEAADPIGYQGGRRPYRGSNSHGRGQQQQGTYQSQYQSNCGQYHNPREVTTKITIMVATEVEVATVVDAIIIEDASAVKAIIEAAIITSTISIMVMMMTTRLNIIKNHSLKHCFKG